MHKLTEQKVIDSFLSDVKISLPHRHGRLPAHKDCAEKKTLEVRHLEGRLQWICDIVFNNWTEMEKFLPKHRLKIDTAVVCVAVKVD